MNPVYRSFLDFLAGLTIFKNRLAKNYFNPESKEAEKIFQEIYLKIISEYPEIEDSFLLKNDKKLVFRERQISEGFVRVILKGEVVFKRGRHSLNIYSSAFSLLGLDKKDYIFIVAHELYHIVHYIYYKKDFLESSEDSRENYANKKALEILEKYYPNKETEISTAKQIYSKKIIFWHKMINNYAPS